jgi:hypothetical protein
MAEGKKGEEFDVDMKPASGAAPHFHAPPHHGGGAPLTDEGIAKELNDAETRRLAQQQAMVDRLKEEDRHAEEVRKKKQSQPADD